MFVCFFLIPIIVKLITKNSHSMVFKQRRSVNQLYRLGWSWNECGQHHDKWRQTKVYLLLHCQYRSGKSMTQKLEQRKKTMPKKKKRECWRSEICEMQILKQWSKWSRWEMKARNKSERSSRIPSTHTPFFPLHPLLLTHQLISILSCFWNMWPPKLFKSFLADAPASYRTTHKRKVLDLFILKTL